MRLLTGTTLATLSQLSQAYTLSHAARFTQWFQQFASNMEPARRQNCSSQYRAYAHEPETADHPETIASLLIDCLLRADALDEATKANMASAQVLLGFLPTILAAVGCDPTETSVLGLRRPVLALLVTIGSPAPSLTRSFIYHDPTDLLKQHTQDINIPQSGATRKSLAVAAQLLLVLLAVANTAELALELGFLTVSSFAPSRPWLVILWTCLGVVVHLFGTVALRLRMDVRKTGRRRRQDESVFSRLVDAARDEFSLCSTHTRTILSWKPTQSRRFVFLAWFTANGTAVVVVYGTVVFSSLMFISTQDATIIVLRYLVSALICRAVLMHELDGIRNASKGLSDDP